MDTGSFWSFFDHHHHHHDPRHEHMHRMGGRGHRHGHGRGFPFGGNPFGGNPFGGGGPFFRRSGRARRGDVRAAILALLAEEPRNGYQLMVEIERRSEGAWRPSPGSMYPALQQLEDEGLVRSESDAGGRTFHLTDKGRAEAQNAARETTPWEDAAGEDSDSFREFAILVRQVTVAAMQVGQAGTRAQVAEARKVLTETRRALYRLLADGEPDDEE